MNQSPDRRVIVERYELGQVIGAGGMGEVRAARDLTLDRPVAIKFLRTQLGQHSDLKARFEVEAKSAARLIHPNIVAVFDSGEEEGMPFIVMELLSGRTLADRVAEGPVPQGEARRLALEILAALHASHAEGILHRDLKPGNVMLTENGSAKVADFGIAKMTEGLDMTTTGMMLGTPAYLAPERVAGEPATPATDVYAAGIVLYELLTGRKPFDADTPLAMVRAIQEDEPEPLADLRPDLDRELIAIVGKAMAKNPSKRYSSSKEMEREVEAWLPSFESDRTQSLSGRTKRMRIRKKGPSKFRRRLAAILIGVLAVAWPAYVMRSADRPDPSEAPSIPPQPAASPVTPLAPALEQALGHLDTVLNEAGFSSALSPSVQQVGAAARAGDSRAVSEQLRLLREGVQRLVQEGSLGEPATEELMAALTELDIEIGILYPAAPVDPTS